MSGFNPKQIMDYDYGTYKGYMAENFVAQEIKAMGRHATTGREEHQKSNFFLKLDMESFQSKLNPVEWLSQKAWRFKKKNIHPKKVMF